MTMWLIGGGIYVATSLFALALCRVAAPTDEGDIQTRAGATTPTDVGTDFERLVGKRRHHAAVVVHRNQDHDQSRETPGSRPSVASLGPSDLRKDSRWPQSSPSPDLTAAPPSLHVS